MNKNTLNERILDEIIKYAVASNIEETKWPKEEELAKEYTFSASFEQKMQELFAQQKRKEKIARMKRSALKIAAGMLIFLSISFVTIMNVDALRVNFLNFINKKLGQYTKISIEDEIKTNTEVLGKVLPSYLPENYNKNFFFENKSSYYLCTYQNSIGNEIALEKLSEWSTAGIDSEDAYMEHLIVNDQAAEYYEKNNYSTLLYKYEG
ncbi:MAG: DUF4367 domain-containing protein, partial [Firmicutes bacterium]|nr:DUF4367 domain-containing protein [Bacillota bacterium]